MSPLFTVQCWFKRLYRQGPHFQKHLKSLEASCRLSPEQLRQYQERHLQKIVRHCYANVPYYQDLFHELKLTPDDIRTVKDLQKLPLMDKHIVRENYDKLIAKSHKNALCRVGSTSGSTGSPGKFLRDYNGINFENAASWRHWMQAGDDGKRRVTLRGDIIVPVSQKQPPFWKYNAANQELLMSGYHLSLPNSRIYIEKIQEFQPAVLYCYPSTASLLAKFFRNEGINYRFDAIFTSSESLEPNVRAYIEETFQCQIFDWYGQAERVAAISQCREGMYHIQEDYSLVETLPQLYGEELVGTHLFSFVMPLLRYRTRDIVDLCDKPCACGSHFRTVSRIHGRNYGYIVTPEGYHVSIINHVPRGVANLIETQFYQEKAGEVTLNVLTNGQFSDRDKAQLIQNTIEHTSPSMKVIVREVSDIPRGPNGKFISIINTMESLN